METTVQILKVTKSEYGTYFNCLAGKKSVYISVTEHSINVCVSNASHKAWGGSGRFFRTFEEAVKAYKSEDVKEILLEVSNYDR